MPLDLEPSTIKKIAPWMPNFFYSTRFGEHEWDKHGTCQAHEDDEYFLLIQRLAEMVDSTIIGDYLRRHTGEKIAVSQLKQAFNEELGEEVANKIQLRCTGRGKRYFNEFRINLPEDIDESRGIEGLVRGADNFSNFKGNCPSTIYIEAPGED